MAYANMADPDQTALTQIRLLEQYDLGLHYLPFN